MPYTGIIKNQVVVLEEGVLLPEGTKVTVFPENNEVRRKELREKWNRFDEGAERVFQQLLAEVGTTSDSVEILRRLRDARADR
ncbi:MAG: hypothetical protein O7E52_10950 [Candidatus Poribacteria bacterium]|nr:hypothetical protein [Candidatus Poribacteria bacterium]